MTPASGKIAPALLRWFDGHGRHGLPWQRDPTPYRVWISEVMLQQTQVETVVPYFERFVARFPDPATLAAAPVDEVMRHWSGLGYYARGRNLQLAARDIVARHRGELPDTLDELMALPGVGRSTAGAILALGSGKRHPILDGNVKRVLSRVFLVESPAESSAALKRLWQLAGDCTPRRRVAAYTQAIMDLGATVCARRNPDCERCPLAGLCAASAVGRTASIPVPRRRAARRQRSAYFVIARAAGRVLLTRRPPRGIWGGLFAPPEFADADAARAFLAARFGVSEPTRRLPEVLHAFTHYDLEMRPWLLETSLPADAAADGETRWHELAALETVGMPAPVARLLEELRDGPHGSLRQARPRGGRPRPAAVSG